MKLLAYADRQPGQVPAGARVSRRRAAAAYGTSPGEHRIDSGGLHGTSPPVAVTSTLTVSSANATTLADATVTISTGLAAGDSPGFTNQNGITGQLQRDHRSADAEWHSVGGRLPGRAAVSHLQLHPRDVRDAADGQLPGERRITGEQPQQRGFADDRRHGRRLAGDPHLVRDRAPASLAIGPSTGLISSAGLTAAAGYAGRQMLKR